LEEVATLEAEAKVWEEEATWEAEAKALEAEAKVWEEEATWEAEARVSEAGGTLEAEGKASEGTAFSKSPHQRRPAATAR
jgi:hypothetical protein